MVDLLVDKSPRLCLNFIKLCKIKYFNFSPFYNIEKDYTCESGDPQAFTGESEGGSSVWGAISGSEEDRWFKPDDNELTHGEKGTVSMATSILGQKKVCGSQFIITLKDKLPQLDDRAVVFGNVVEGLETLDKINNAYIDEKGRPLKDIRIRHTYVLDDPFEDPDGLSEPPTSPGPTPAQLKTVRIGSDEDVIPDEEEGQEAERRRQDRLARSKALTLEVIGDLPFAEVKPSERTLFVCKLNPVTEDEDLELIFSRFGKIVSCQIVRDKQTGDSLQYAFVEFEDKEACVRAYFKMEGVLIDDHRIHVDFSQSVANVQNERRTTQRRRRRDEDDRRDRRDYRRDRRDDRRDDRDEREFRDKRDDRDWRGHRDRRDDRDKRDYRDKRDHRDRDRDRGSRRDREGEHRQRYRDRSRERDRHGSRHDSRDYRYRDRSG